MADTAITETIHAGGFLLSEANFARSRDQVTIKSGQGVLVAGTVLGKITVGGEYVAAADASVTGEEGAETAVAILFEGVDATSAAVEATVISRDAEVRGDALTYDTSVGSTDDVPVKNTQLAAVGIIVR